MKHFKLVILLVLTVIGTACSTQGAKTEQQSEKSSSSDEGKVVKIDKTDFLSLVYNYEANPDQWVYEGDLPAIIDFYADWCAPCRLIAPIMDELAQEYKGKIRIYKVDTEKQKELAGVFQVRSIPTILFIPMQGKPQMSMGALPKETFRQVIEEFMLSNKQ